MSISRVAARSWIDSRSTTSAHNSTWDGSLRPTSTTLTSPKQYGDPPYGRTVYTCVALVCMFVLAALMGSRAKQLRFHNLITMNFIRFLILLLNMLGIMFVLAASILESGIGLVTPVLCESAIIICLVFYVGSKVAMYFFLIERAHALRSPYLRRFSDWIWVISSVTVITGFGSIAVFAFIYPLAELSRQDGRCRIGLPLKITIPLLIFDVIINTGLTGVFVHLLLPLLSVGPGPQGLVIGPPTWTTKLTVWLCRLCRVKQHPENAHVHPSNRSFLKGVEKLLWKSLIGTIMVLLPTVGNLGLLYHMKGREQGWICFMICTLDVTWAICVIHWLTVDPIEVNNRMLGNIHIVDTSSTVSPSESGVIHN